MNTLFIISGSSGSGKTTVVERLVNEKELNLERGVTYTGRHRREGEDPKAYEFESNRRLEELVEAHPDLFIEYNYYAGNIYATPISIIERLLYNNVILIEDVNGAEAIEKKYRGKFNIVSIFLKSNKLRENLKNRGEESIDIKLRLDPELLKKEEEKSKNFSHIIMAENPEETFICLRNLINFELQKGQK